VTKASERAESVQEGSLQVENTRILFNIQVDCEATQRTIQNPQLGERAVRGIADVLAHTDTKATFAVIPTDLQAHATLYRELRSQGHEVGLHMHPAEQGYEEFLGLYGWKQQKEIIGSAAWQFAEVMGYRPLSFTPGYFSANDHTFPVLEELEFSHGSVSLPTRDLPQCACVWGSSPLDGHYAHRYNRCLSGDVNFVEIPPTVDPASRLWGGAHPQDLRVELVDAKNHWYTVNKNVERQLRAGMTVPVKYIKALTHNVFEYGEVSNFRRETLLGIIRSVQDICLQQGAEFIPATTGEIAEQYRRIVPLPTQEAHFSLDTRGRSYQTSSR
jgi:peptidoglycan/xylan/chitin deacetylase (PgdA/CDA1 family)